jgi:FlaA1/EpsC-like NDP-sugar epimerase
MNDDSGDGNERNGGGGSSSSEASQIAAYFKDKCVFVTGATGFLGKVLIEKLLYSCGSLKCIYVLVREKKGKSPSERLEEMLNAHGVSFVIIVWKKNEKTSQ